ncbi:hypothetical protein GOD68_18090 [Sinorhizobium medicae]|nr:hypothetical protein [Sinorhizobium medicae]
METREERQTKLDARIAELRAQADAKQAEADRIQATVNSDYAFWTQPAYSNAAGRAFARQRDRERSKAQRAAEAAMEAKALREKADAMERRGVVMAGDTAAKREAVIASTEVEVGQLVDTTFYGVRKVLKVNKKSVLVEGSIAPIKVEKNFVRAA